MQIAKGTLLPFVKLCLYSGICTVLSFVSFSMVYHFANPDVETFTRFFKNHTVWKWVQFNFGSWGAFGLSLVFIATTVTASFVGFVCAIFAKVLHGKATETLKSGLGG